MQTPAVLDDLVATCQQALLGDNPHRTIYLAMQELLQDPATLAAQIPAFADDEVPTSALGWRLGGEHVVHRNDDLTVLVLDTLPGVIQPPHEHNMNVCIGVFAGCEEQRFWQRTDTGIASAPGRMLEAGEVLSLGVRAIHAISAPAGRPGRAVHVYLGDIYAVERSVFDPDSLAEYPMTADRYDEFCKPAN